MDEHITVFLVLFGVNLLLLSFNAGVLWNKVGTLVSANAEIRKNLHDLRDAFNYLSGQLSISHGLHRKEQEENS